MRKLSGDEKRDAEMHLEMATLLASHSSYKHKFGSVILHKDYGILGEGYNSLPQDKCLDFCFKDSLSGDFKLDRDCYIHAEEVAIMDALNKYPSRIQGATLYFSGGKQIPTGKPNCPTCSEKALDAGIENWVLRHEKGVYIYGSDEYHQISSGLKEWGLEPKAL